MSTVSDAAYHTVHDYPGGAESLAPRMELSAQVLRNKVAPNCMTHHLYLTQAVRMMELTGDHRILRAQCRDLGYLDPIRVVTYDGIADEQLLELVSAVHSETGDVSRSLVEAIKDGQVTEKEMDAFDEQVIEAMTALAELRDRLRGMVVESTSERGRR